MIFVLLDYWLYRLVKSPIKTKWVLTEKCGKCGKCCKEIKLYIEPKMLSSKFVSNMVIAWTSWLFNFKLKRIDYDRSDLVFECKTLGPDGTCMDYKWRPSVCRSYPLVDYFEEPALFSICGYKKKLRN
jgi:hypothetical protein